MLHAITALQLLLLLIVIVCCLYTLQGLVSGGRDGLVKIWRAGLELRLTINLHLLKVVSISINEV
jgi:hypothetical protein